MEEEITEPAEAKEVVELLNRFINYAFIPRTVDNAPVKGTPCLVLILTPEDYIQAKNAFIFAKIKLLFARTNPVLQLLISKRSPEVGISIISTQGNLRLRLKSIVPPGALTEYCKIAGRHEQLALVLLGKGESKSSRPFIRSDDDEDNVLLYLQGIHTDVH